MKNKYILYIALIIIFSYISVGILVLKFGREPVYLQDMTRNPEKFESTDKLIVFLNFSFYDSFTFINNDAYKNRKYALLLNKIFYPVVLGLRYIHNHSTVKIDYISDLKLSIADNDIEEIAQQGDAPEPATIADPASPSSSSPAR